MGRRVRHVFLYPCDFSEAAEFVRLGFVAVVDDNRWDTLRESRNRRVNATGYQHVQLSNQRFRVSRQVDPSLQ